MPFNALRSENFTDAGTISKTQISKTVVGMAHFSGTGPEGTACGQCEHWRASPVSRCKATICFKYRQMTGDERKNVPSLTPSCRHFEVRHKT